MTDRSVSPSVADVIDALEREALLAPDWRDSLAAKPGYASDVAPWFVRGMVGFGAWLAALLLITFVASISIAATGGGYLVLAVIFIGASIGVRYAFDTDFIRQLTLAFSLAGQGLLAASIFETGGLFDETEAVLAALAVLNSVLLFVFPDRTHRFLSTVAVVACVCGLLYVFEIPEVLPFVGPGLIALLLVLFHFEPKFAARGWLGAVSAVRAGLLTGAFGCLTLSAFYLPPEFIRDFVFYPRPWISSLLFAAILFYVERDFIGIVFGDVRPSHQVAAYALTALVIAAALPAPGLVLALLVLVIGGVQSSAFYRGAGIAFVAIFTAAYFYGIDVGMLVKSASLVGTGLVVLGCRWLFLRATGQRSDQPPAPVSPNASDAASQSGGAGGHADDTDA